MLPYLADRPLVLTRFPDGINGKSFFQKDAPEYAQAFVRTITIWSEDSQRELDYFVCDNESSLLFIANMVALQSSKSSLLPHRQKRPRARPTPHLRTSMI